MIEKKDLRPDKYYKVQGKGNDIFKKGESVHFIKQEGLAYIFKQGSVEIVINELGIEKFLANMDFADVE
ncbi:MAG TPA: hypothetical protein VHT34_14655 [Clostridia bacterium]|nr:hypothetical protein [Clostridia bacterium]